MGPARPFAPTAHLSLIEEGQRANLDALPGWRICRHSWIVKRAVRRKTGLAVIGIEALEQKRLAVLHIRKIEPAVAGIVGNPVGFTGPVVCPVAKTYLRAAFTESAIGLGPSLNRRRKLNTNLRRAATFP